MTKEQPDLPEPTEQNNHSQQHTHARKPSEQRSRSKHEHQHQADAESQTHIDLIKRNPIKKVRNRSLFYKLGSMAVLTLFFLMGMQFIDGLVNERENYQTRVINDIKRMHTREQQVVTPIVMVPQTLKYPCKEKQEYETGKFRDVNKTCVVKQIRHLVPTQSSWKHQVDVSNDNYKRSIYRAISYNDTLIIDAQYNLKDSKLAEHARHVGTLKEDSITNHWQDAKIILPISDLRGLKHASLHMQNKKQPLTYPETEEYLGLTYVESPFRVTEQSPVVPVRIDVGLSGISGLSAIPLGKAFSMSVNANWPHPQFFGNALPNKQIESTHFQADWSNTYHSVANTQKLNVCAQNIHESCSLFSGYSYDGYTSKDSYSGFGVQFVNSADTYTFTDRTIKYALLLLMVVFGAFFLFEVTKNLRIHPVQYSLVAAALLVFYVLLLSLSEQIDFSIAYLSAAIACVSLLGWYVFYVLKSVGRAALFASILAGLYASFYVIIQSEDNSLIMGSVFLFVMLAAVMFFTRHINWYEKN